MQIIANYVLSVAFVFLFFVFLDANKRAKKEYLNYVCEARKHNKAKETIKRLDNRLSNRGRLLKADSQVVNNIEKAIEIIEDMDITLELNSVIMLLKKIKKRY